MKTIYRYEIKKDINDVKLPIGAKILHIGLTSDWEYVNDNPLDDTRNWFEVPCIWALVDSDEELTETRRFVIFGTGADLDPIMDHNPTYIGSYQKQNRYMFHVFEVEK